MLESQYSSLPNLDQLVSYCIPLAQPNLQYQTSFSLLIQVSCVINGLGMFLFILNSGLKLCVGLNHL